jgi:hypothetical protein
MASITRSREGNMQCIQAGSGSFELGASYREGDAAFRRQPADELGHVDRAVAEFRAIAESLEPSAIDALLQVARIVANELTVHPAARTSQIWSRRV